MRAKPFMVSDKITKGQGWKSNQTDKAEPKATDD